MPVVKYEIPQVPLTDFNAESWWTLPTEWDPEDPDYWSINVDFFMVCRSDLEIRIGVGMNCEESAPALLLSDFPDEISIDDALDFAAALEHLCATVREALRHPRRWSPPAPGKWIP